MYSFGFFLKKLISAFLMPLPVCLSIVIIGLVFLWFTKRQKIGKILVTAGTALIFIMSMEIVLDIIISPLDQAYPVYRADKNKPVKFVVVLSGGAGFKNGIPMNTSSSYVTLSRLMEGLRVYRCNQGSRIILTGGPVSSRVPFSIIEACFLVQLGIPKEDLILDIKSLDTAEEALNVRKIIKGEQFVLVTSSIHMPRALKLFQKQGMNPTPAPTGFRILSSDLSLSDFILIPNSDNLRAIDTAIHEHLGTLWSKMHGQL
jgi:uncharacterized SAM-binding protein YcdF (DUF218 family)